MPKGGVGVHQAEPTVPSGAGAGAAWHVASPIIAYLGDASTEEAPVDLCITQARYTQLHRSINYSQE